MGKFIINGGRPLNGYVDISGSKNSAVAIIPAALLVDGKCIIENVPDIGDVNILTDVLVNLGARVQYEDKNTISIDACKR
jgi:UDP-N-acetylglucosamine 1-carboxyvinyltransferase